MGDVIPLGCITRLNLPVGRVLEEAKGMVSNDGVVVLGWGNDGEMYFASSLADGGDVLWLIEKAKKALLEVND